MSESAIKIEESWNIVLKEEFEKPYFKKLIEFLKEEKETKTIYPKGSTIFNAFNSTPFDKVKVIILGQDPYHGENQAHGLCFSVQKGVKTPPSLANIYKELRSDINHQTPSHGCLQEWAAQGVFLLNSILTVEANKAASHQNKGWEIFTDAVIEKLSNEREHLIFMLWGNYAKNKANFIDQTKHLVLTAAHPSPFSAYNGFLGCKHFSKANDYLLSINQQPIDWAITA